MLIEKIAIFIIFLGPLVFFHELGHFLFARLAGVRVEVFSIGFGPKLFKWKRKDTEYTISAIPLGGYVKMFGDDPLKAEELTEEEKKVAFTHKTKWQRFWIVFGGPLANFIMAFFIYLSLVNIGETLPQARFGIINPDSKYYELGFRTGDALKEINNKPIMSFDDLNLVDSKVKSISVERDDDIKTIDVKLDGIKFVQDFSSFQNQLRAPIVIGEDSKTYLISTKSDKSKINLYKSIQELFTQNPTSIYLFELKSNPRDLMKLEDIELSSEAIKLEVSGNLETFLYDNNYFTIDMAVNGVSPDSAAARAELNKGDVILEMDGKKLYNFENLKQTVQNSKPDQKRELVIFRNGKKEKLSLTPEKVEVEDKNIFRIGVESNVIFLPMEMVESRAKNFLSSIPIAWDRTIDGMYKVMLGFKKLITAEVPLKNIGGPVAIGKVAADSFDISLSMFFRLMAIISINLGIINLFPIPVLDGGHIVFIIFEFFNRGPLSRKKIMVAQQFGMSLLFLLIFVALFNDFSRIFS